MTRRKMKKKKSLNFFSKNQYKITNNYINITGNIIKFYI